MEEDCVTEPVTVSTAVRSPLQRLDLAVDALRTCVRSLEPDRVENVQQVLFEYRARHRLNGLEATRVAWVGFG